jgi:nucleotide-binding universal stress UspA family protein
MAKRILLPLGPGTPADSFIAAVGDLARGAGATVRLVRVVDAPSNVIDVDGRIIAYADQETIRVEAEARDDLETIALMLDGVPGDIVVRFGDPVPQILAEAEAFGADLIALGVRHRRRFRLDGGVADRVARRATTPVALWHAGPHEAGTH